MEKSDSSISSSVDKSLVASKASSSGGVLGLAGYLSSSDVFVLRVGEADFFRFGVLLADAGRPSDVTVVPSWRARKRVVTAREFGVWATADGSSEAECVLLWLVDSELSFSSSFLSFFALRGGMIGVEVVYWYESMEWAFRWTKHLIVDLVKTTILVCEIAK